VKPRKEIPMGSEDATNDGVLSNRSGQLATMASGRMFPIEDPKPEHFNVYDVAHHLSLINRFSGATREPYSVAAHMQVCGMIATSDILYDMHQEPDINMSNVLMWAITHDIPEFIIGDNIRPVKRVVPKLMVLEAKIMDAVVQWLGLPVLSEKEKRILRFIDNLACSCERQLLMPMYPDWPEMPEPDYRIVKVVATYVGHDFKVIRDNYIELLCEIFELDRTKMEVPNGFLN
jgi:hypothetical protein